MHSKRLLIFARTQILCRLNNVNETKRCIYSGQTSLKDDEIKGDWMGPADRVSNLLTFKLYIPENETKTERQYREQRIAVHQWNHEFWEKHNIDFYNSQKMFVKKTLEEKYKNEPDRTTLPVEDMAVFYKQFLDKNYQMHLSYNKEWYKRNFLLVWFAFKVKVANIWRNRTRTSHHVAQKKELK